MEIHKINTISLPISASLLPRPAGIPNFKSMETVAAKEGISGPRQSEFIDFQKINDTLNTIARGQRVFEKSFQKIDDYIERMKAQLEQIVKQFPPFPPGSEDRVRALRAYAYFRNLIDQLTIPPPDEPQIGAMSELISICETSDGGEETVSNQPPNPNHPIEIQKSS